MKRKKIAVAAACLLLGTMLLAGCGEEEPIPSGTEAVTVGSQEQTAPEVSGATESVTTLPEEAAPPQTTAPTATEPAQTEQEEPAATEPVGTEPEEPISTEPVGTESEEPAATEPVGTESEETTSTESTKTDSEQATPTEPTQPDPTEPEETKPSQPVPPAGVCSVETGYGELHFQDRWSPYMQIRQEQEGDVVRVYFMAHLDEKDYPLFDLTIRPEPGTDDRLQLTDASGGKHAVEVNMEESIEHEELDSAGQELLYSMQEQVNFIIENLT